MASKLRHHTQVVVLLPAMVHTGLIGHQDRNRFLEGARRGIAREGGIAALSWVSQHGTPAEKKAVRAAEARMMRGLGSFM